MTKEEVFSIEKFIPTPPEKPFYFGVTGLNHGHIHSMCSGLINAGAKMTHIYEPDEALLAGFLKKYPELIVCKSLDELLRRGWDVGVAWQDGRQHGGTTHIRLNLALPLSRVKEAFERMGRYVFNTEKHV